ncbi:MAG: RsmD family RNA methyltransferase [Victivallaceae bacterium]|nr:RsmD family RNA methyltransferase [Victivallaceae bacterium]
MKIISGYAANVELETPEDLTVRPTLGRTRKALFDHLGDFSGCRVLDLFAGSGALGLEAASRGAGFVALVENDPAHARLIGRNADKVRRTGCPARIEIFVRDARTAGDFLEPDAAGFDFVFADPPYADSAECCAKLLNDARFRDRIGTARIVWEIPDRPGAVGEFLSLGLSENGEFRKFGVTTFYLGARGK